MAKTAFEEQEYSQNLDLGLWKKVFIYAWKYKLYLALIAISMLICAAADAIYPLLTRKAIDAFVVPKNTDGLTLFILEYLAVILIQAISVWGFIALAGKVELGIIYDIRRAAFRHLQELSFSYYDKTPVGWLMARLTSDCMNLGSTIAWGMVDFVWGFAMMIMISGIMFSLNWKLTLIVMTVVPPLVLVSIYFQKLILKSYRDVRKINSKITGAFNEGITGAKTTKTLTREDDNFLEFKELTQSMYSSSVQAAIRSSLFLPIVLIIGTIGSGLALWFGGEGVINGVITYGTLVAFVTYMIRFFEPIRELARIFAQFQNAQASAERIFSLLETKPDIKDDKDIIELYEKNPTIFLRKNRIPLAGNIELKNISFQYKEGEKVFDNFNLKINAGETIAVVGETGAGKSTLVNLICRFYEPTEGQILFDGKDYRKLPLHMIQSNIGMVLQTPHLFSGSIKDNIRYGKLDASDEEIINSAKLVHAHDFIMKLPNQYDTEVGEGGSLLSTGQKQLITFARAIISNPTILILDEATSSVDTEAEVLIQKAIDVLLQDRTSFIIAHRLSTIKNADRILVIENGKIIEEGNHKELLKIKGHYYQLFTNQFIEENQIFATK